MNADGRRFRVLHRASGAPLPEALATQRGARFSTQRRQDAKTQREFCVCEIKPSNGDRSFKGPHSLPSLAPPRLCSANREIYSFLAKLFLRALCASARCISQFGGKTRPAQRRRGRGEGGGDLGTVYRDLSSQPLFNSFGCGWPRCVFALIPRCMAKAARSKKAWFQKPLQVIRHQRLTDLCRPRKNVLTAKKGLFLAVLAGKRGFRAGKKAFYFAIFHVLVVFFFCMWLSGNVLRFPAGFQKNRA